MNKYIDDRIDKLIAYLEDIKKSNKTNLCIDFMPEITEIASTYDGTMLGKKHLKIDITFEELYTKNKFDLLGDWKLESKGV